MRKMYFRIVVGLAFGCLVSGSLQASPEPSRSRQSFNTNWKFARFGPMPDKSTKPEPKGLEIPGLDDSKWRTLNVPHDWGIEGPFRDDLENNTGKLPWRGIGWYRKTFTVPAADKGKRIFIDFDGAMANSKVYLNGQYVGGWPFGYMSFRLELTDHVKFGEKNVLAVRLDTVKWGSRWYPGAGIYRNVWLVKTNPVHIGHWGTYVTTPIVTDEKGEMKLIATIDNQGTQAVTATVTTDVFEYPKNDVAGKKVASSKPASVQIAAGKTAKATINATVTNPKRWDIVSPNRYLARTTVKVGDKIVDTYDTPFGFRTLKFTSKKGFYLNGRRVVVQGVCQHHDLGPLGSAVNTRALERQIEILQEMGCNAIRTSHNPPTPELLELCDKMGMLVQDETFDCWMKGKRANDYSAIFHKWYEKDTRALARRDRNHPCVFMWSTGNEIPNRQTAEGKKFSKRMTAIYHEEDPTRPVTNGCNGATRHMKNGFQLTTDIYGFNYAIGGYKQFHKVKGNENRIYHGSETASTVSSRGEYFFPVSKKKENAMGTKNKADFQMSSYDVQAPGWGCPPDDQFKVLDQNPACFGEFVWTGFDYLGEPTPYNKDVSNLLNFTDPKKKAELKKQLDKLGKLKVPSRSSYFGIVDLCGFKKDRFYIYQARWRANLPMAHILPHWNWAERVGQVTPVHVYTSGDEAELFLNGKSLGRKKKGQFEYRLRWDDVKYQPGELKVIAYKNGKQWATDTVKTTGKAAKVSAKADRATIAADGKDLSFVTIKVLDKKGLMVPRSHNMVKFKIEGPGEIVAVGNGNAASHEPFQVNYRKVYNGMCLVVIRSKPGQAGNIRLTAKSDGLASDTITITTK